MSRTSLPSGRWGTSFAGSPRVPGEDVQPAILTGENHICAAAGDFSRSLGGIAGDGDQRRALGRAEHPAHVGLGLRIGPLSPGQPVGEQPEPVVELVEADLVDAQAVDANHQTDSLGLREQQDPPRLTRTGSGRTGIQHHPGALLERHRDAQVPSHLHLLSIGAADQELAGGQRADGLGQYLIRWPGLQKIHDRINRRELGDGVRAEQHRSGIDQAHDGRDEPLGHGHLVRPRTGRPASSRVGVIHVNPASVHSAAAGGG